MVWRVRKSDIAYFHDELWKDLRPFPRASNPENFAKDCFTEEAATIEASIMMLLGERLGFDAIPRPVAVEGSVLVMKRAEGVRLFDLIRHLKSFAGNELEDMATEALTILRSRCKERLRSVQLHLAELAPLYSHKTYPLDEKLTCFLELFLRVMDIRSPLDWRGELSDFLAFWEMDCVSVPFRDATTKNMIIIDPRLNLNPSDDMEISQRKMVAELLASESQSFWSEVPLMDVDFSSIVHLTSAEDDPISLLCHEWTASGQHMAPAEFILDNRLGVPDGGRAAATLLVRYLRFGGRKLAYRIINSQGFKVRFAFDNPMFYFETLRKSAEQLSPEFVLKYPGLFSVVEAIAVGWNSGSRADHEHLNVDHLRRYYQVEHYWQQSPSEYL